MKAQARYGIAALALAAGVSAGAATPALAEAPPGATATGATTPPTAAPAKANAAASGLPRIRQMVVFPSGKVLAKSVVAKRATARVDGRRCAVPAATPLAALIHSRPGTLALHDYGSCSNRPADASGLFVKQIRTARNRLLDGWVYKLGRRLGTAGGADPTGPFGAGRLRPGAEVVWFYCRQRGVTTCQRSLEIETEVEGRRVAVTVTGYDDAAKGAPARGATVHAGKRSATADAEGRATLTLPRGTHTIHASKRGAIRSFDRKVVIR